jgi:hypothetical protein
VVEFMTAEGDVLAISIPSVRVRRRHAAASGDLLEALPEGIHNANARPASGDDDGVFDDRRFHPRVQFDPMKDHEAIIVLLPNPAPAPRAACAAHRLD